MNLERNIDHRGEGRNARKERDRGKEHYLHSVGTPANTLRSGESHRRPRMPSTLPPPPSPSPLAFSSNRMNCGVGWVSNEVESKWNREGRRGEVRDVVDGNRSSGVACGRRAVPPHASEWQPLTAGWQPTCGRTDSHTAHAPRPTWRRKPAGLFQDSCTKLPTEMLACGRDDERPHV